MRNKLVHGTPWQLEAARERCFTSKKINTAYVERLNLFIRSSIRYLHRRTSCLTQRVEKLADSIDMLQCYYNFVRPHQSLRFGKEKRTPAMEAGLTSRVLRLRDIFLAFAPNARVGWLKDETTRRDWGSTRVWLGNNS
ncbi:MAG: hypothetical protein JNL28_00875 [Planctomycetes bacterium]|nr:hypothetical protein [Planctomycetota bacterium]